MEDKLRRSCANEAFVMCKLLCVVLMSESLDICLYVVLELPHRNHQRKQSLRGDRAKEGLSYDRWGRMAGRMAHG